MPKTNKELVAELTTSFITSWNSKEHTKPLNMVDVKGVFNSFKQLIESMDEKDG
ncbi:hypothetical protein [Clostridium sporogenes]|uniref:hypothetical protein n=1 Tax=Clostridium sporogenes TaxID=1509 RepID=UPI000B303C55|nr:hypothetical protein [Clostridium sporogenes]